MLKNGQEIFELFCQSSAPNSIMFPRAPDQKYIDVYPSSFVDERKHQLDYETEVKVYRALEGLDQNLIVLHSFDYTHRQVCPVRNKKKCGQCKNPLNVEGECDFVVLGFNYCVIIEVKNMPHVFIEEGSDDWKKEIRALVGTFRKSVKQRSKMESVIKNIDPGTAVLQFTAYPNFSKSFKGHFQNSEDEKFRLSDDELSSVIFEEDFENVIDESTNASDSASEPTRGTVPRWDKFDSNFREWWEQNVTKKVSHSAQLTPAVRNILLATWSTEKSSTDQSKFCYGKVIMDIDRRLKDGYITFQPGPGSNRRANPLIIEPPVTIRSYIGVVNLTVEQSKVFNSSKRLNWINGPAGTGKSVILWGKFIEVALKSRGKVVFFIFTGNGNNSKYEEALDSSGVSYQMCKASDNFISELSHLISQDSSSAILVEIGNWGKRVGQGGVLDLEDAIKNAFLQLKDNRNYHVFVDDFQEIIHYCGSDKSFSDITNAFLVLSVKHFVWIACDVSQDWINTGSLDDALGMISKSQLSNSHFSTLQKNLRNTQDIANVLLVIRDQIMEDRFSHKYFNLETILPKQHTGHYIHGCRPIFNVLYSYDQLVDVLEAELEKLRDNSIMNIYPDICIVHNGQVLDIVNALCIDDDIKSKISTCAIENCYSSEWPVVFVLQLASIEDESELRRLYMMMSRARVYCSVCLYPEKGKKIGDDGRIINDLAVKLKDDAIIRRPPPVGCFPPLFPGPPPVPVPNTVPPPPPYLSVP